MRLIGTSNRTSNLVGGFNPSEKYVRQIGNLPQGAKNKNNTPLEIHWGTLPKSKIVLDKLWLGDDPFLLDLFCIMATDILWFEILSHKYLNSFVGMYSNPCIQTVSG